MAYIELKNIENTDYFYQEAIKTLRTNLQFCGSSVRVIMFTSTMPSEGKSSTAFAVAVSMANIRKRVLFIDADIRKSMMVKTHEITGHTSGLSQYLSGQNKCRTSGCGPRRTLLPEPGRAFRGSDL